MHKSQRVINGISFRGKFFEKILNRTWNYTTSESESELRSSYRGRVNLYQHDLWFHLVSPGFTWFYVTWFHRLEKGDVILTVLYPESDGWKICDSNFGQRREANEAQPHFPVRKTQLLLLGSSCNQTNQNKNLNSAVCFIKILVFSVLISKWFPVS